MGGINPALRMNKQSGAGHGSAPLIANGQARYQLAFSQPRISMALTTREMATM